LRFCALDKIMGLCRFAADSLIREYLHGRTLPEMFYSAAVAAAETRLMAGAVPVLDAPLRNDIDDHAVAPAGAG
jgi:hypothetical protein